MDNKGFNETSELMRQRADIQSRIALVPFDGSLEIKEISGIKYVYARKREGGRNTSKYVSPYSEEAYALLLKEAQELRSLKRELRHLDKKLAELGYSATELSPRVLLNIDFGRANMKSLIYDQAVLEGVGTTFPQTETIIDNGKVNGVKASDVQKVLNLKHAWEFILDKDVVSSPSDYYLLSYIAKLVNEGFYEDGGRIRSVPVSIGGSSYIPPIPFEQDIKDKISYIENNIQDKTDAALELALFIMKTQVFNDGNKRTAVIFANQYLISKGLGLLAVPEAKVSVFKKLLVSYYEGTDKGEIKKFLKSYCIRPF